MWTQILSLTRSIVELARDIAGRRKQTQPIPVTIDDADPYAARQGTVSGAAGYEASKRAGK